MAGRRVFFGTGLDAWNGADVAAAAETARLVAQADDDGLDLFTPATEAVRRFAHEIVPAVREAVSASR